MNTGKCKAIIFDMDGTMVDNMPIHNKIWIEYLTELGAQIDLSTFHDQTAGKTNPEIMRMFLGAEHDPQDLQVLGQEKEIRYRQRFRAQVQPVPGLMDFLQRARAAGVKLGVATSAPAENVTFVLGELGLERFFDAIVNGEEVVNGKPDPEIFLKAAERLGVPSETCLVFEDSRVGIEAARRAGMHAILVTTGIEPRMAHEVPGARKAVENFEAVSLGDIQGVFVHGQPETGPR
jgi:beta-phosphoglucomutase family hydrolase